MFKILKVLSQTSSRRMLLVKVDLTIFVDPGSDFDLDISSDLTVHNSIITNTNVGGWR